jgi:hypothetical protein
LTVLHPQHKLSYFAKADWDPSWIATARDIITEEFEHSYPETGDAEEVGDDVVEVESEKVQIYSVDNVHLLRKEIKVPGNIFDNLPALAMPRATELLNELERYLATDPEHTDNVLQWWWERRSMFPRLSRMALDYLTIPGMFLTSRLFVHAKFWYSYFCGC